MSLTEAVLLGILQGLTEFLPVSSSGHLVIMQDILNVRAPGISFEVVAHFGTFLAVMVAFAREIRGITGQLWLAAQMTLAGKGIREALRRYPLARLGTLILVANVPAAIIGLGLKSTFEKVFESATSAAAMLLITGTVLALISRINGGDRVLERVRYLDGITIGFAQAVAIIPGISRSGLTIATGIMTGLEREAAARFSFLLSLPAVAGAFLLDLANVAGAGGAGPGRGALAAGLAASFLAGLVALQLTLKLVSFGRLGLFSYYLWAAGALTLAWKLL